MYPLLAQVELNITELAGIVGGTTTVVILFMLAILVVGSRWSKKSLVETEVDAETQSAVTKMAFKNAEQVIDLQKQIATQNTQIISFMEKRANDREEYHQLKSDHTALQKDFKLLQGTVKQHEQKIARLNQDLASEQRKNVSLQRQLDDKTQQLNEKTEQLAYYKAENKSLKLENERYKSYQQKNDTKPIPNIEFLEDGNTGDELMTPIVKPLDKPTEALDADTGDNNSTQSIDEDKRKIG